MMTTRTWWLLAILGLILAGGAVYYLVPWGQDDSLKIVARAGKARGNDRTIEFKLNRKVHLTELKVIEIEPPPIQPGQMVDDVYAGEPGDQLTIWHLVPDEPTWEKRREEGEEDLPTIPASLPVQNLRYGGYIRGMIRPDDMPRPPKLQDGAVYELQLKTASGHDATMQFKAP